jgi:hypothetical protein
MERGILSLVIIITLSTLWKSCNFSNNPMSNQESEFQEYIKTLDHINLPLKISPYSKLPNISNDFDEDGFKKFKHGWASKPLGVLFNQDNLIGLIDYSIGDAGPSPFLSIFNSNGEKLDSSNFYNKAGWDIGYEAFEYITFNEDKTITVIDTVKRWKLNEDKSDILENTETITSGKVTYKILKEGKIIRVFDNFENFFERFNSDSLFQISRIQFPLEYFSIELGDDKVKTTKIDLKNWGFLSLDNDPEQTNGIDEYSQNIKSYGDTIKVELRGIDNGIHCDYVFLQLKEQWTLISQKDFSS